MNGLAEDVDLSPLLGLQIEQMRFGKGAVQFLFDGNVRIAVEGIIDLQRGRSELEIDNYCEFAAELCQVIGLNVVTAERTSNGGLRLELSSGVVVKLQNSESQYESFQIHLGDKVFVA